MKNFTFSTKKKISLMLFSLVLTGISYGATFTASTSGKFSSTATWSGGVVPPTTVLVDQIVIQSGVTVNLDNNITINGAIAELDVAGTLTTSTNSTLTLTLGTLKGAGVIVLNTVDVNASSTFSFTGSLTASTLNTASDLQSSATIVVGQAMNLKSGTLSLVSGGSLQMSNNGTIYISGGLLSLGSGGSVNLTGNYNVTYTNNSSVAGVELTGSGLNNVTVNVNSSSTVTLSSDLVLGGTLSLTSGTLLLSGKDLTINGDIAGSGSGTIAATLPSSITIATASSTSGSLNFSSTANTVKNLTLSIGNSGSTSIGSNLYVNDVLQFNAGKLNIDDNALIIGATGSIKGSGSSSYIITTSGGYVEMHATAGGSTSIYYPVGTSTNYAPAYINLQSGSAAGQVRVGVVSDVMAQGTTGTDISATLPLVDATWNVSSDVTANLNMDLQVMWSAAMEVNGFNRGSAYISHFTNAKWDMSAKAAATAEAGGMFSLKRTGLTSLSPFAVYDQKTAAAVDEVNKNISFELYPNPAVENIVIHNNTTSAEPINIAIYNAYGQLIGNYKLTGTNPTIPVTDLVSGNYYIKFYNNNVSTTKSFIKI